MKERLSPVVLEREKFREALDKELVAQAVKERLPVPAREKFREALDKKLADQAAKGRPVAAVVVVVADPGEAIK